jgi:hypothetical protein
MADRISRRAALAAATLALSAFAGPAAAMDTAAGRWAIEGRVGDKAFTLDCRFNQSGQAISGACVDGDTHDARVKGGRSHTLTRGSLQGDQIAFAYRSSFGIIGFEARYAGVLSGDRITGSLAALGAKGEFTGHRVGS